MSEARGRERGKLLSLLLWPVGRRDTPTREGGGEGEGKGAGGGKRREKQRKEVGVPLARFQWRPSLRVTSASL